jgi:ribosomal protein L24
MRRRGDRITITSGKYAGYQGTVEANVYQNTMDYPDEWANGFHVILDSEEVVTG